MSEQANNTAGGNSPASSTGIPALSATSSPADIIAALGGQSFENLDGLLAADSPKAEVVPTVPEAGNVPPVVVPPVVPPVAPPAPPTPSPAAPDAKVVDEDSPRLGKFRLEATNFKDAEAMRLVAQSQDASRVAKKEGRDVPVMTLREAMEKVYGSTPVAPASTAPEAKADAPAAPAAPVTTEIDTQITTVTADIARIEKEINAAAEEADTAKVSKLTREISRKERELDQLNADKRAAVTSAETERTTAEQTNFRQKAAQARAELVALYPTLGDKTSADRIELDQFLTLKSGDPDYRTIFDSPRWPLILGREFAEAKKLSTATPGKSEATPPPVAPAAPRVTSATVVTPGASTEGGATPTAETFKADLSKFSLADLDKLQALTG